jgi:hypothetical protein
MRPLLFLTSFLFLIFFQACAQPDYLIFGKGGGFSGNVMQYRITHKGKIYKGSGLVDIRYTLAGKIKRSEAKKVFDEMNSIHESAFHHPGNVYYFIRKVNEEYTTEYTWGENGYEVSESIRILYKNAMNRFSEIHFRTLKKPIE